MTSDHHWQEGLPPEPDTHFGMVYEIHHLPTGKKYIGRKQYWFRSGKGPKQADTDIRGKKWKDWHWKPSDWRTYTGSPTDKDLKKLLKTRPQDFEFSIIQQCVSKRDLSFAEPAQMHRRGVGVLRDEGGELVYLNRHIPECYGAVSEWYTKGCSPSEETREKLRGNTNASGPRTEEAKLKMSEGSKSPHYDKAKAAFDAGQTTFTRDEPCPRCGGTLYKLTRHKTQRSGFTMACRDCNTEAQRKTRAKKKEKSQ